MYCSPAFVPFHSSTYLELHSLQITSLSYAASPRTRSPLTGAAAESCCSNKTSSPPPRPLGPFRSPPAFRPVCHLPPQPHNAGCRVPSSASWAAHSSLPEGVWVSLIKALINWIRNTERWARISGPSGSAAPSRRFLSRLHGATAGCRMGPYGGAAVHKISSM